MREKSERRNNVAIVVLDTLRKDAFDRHFEWLPGVRYDNAWSSSHWTVPAHASLFSGRYGSELGVHGKSKTYDCPDPSIAELLSEKGYNTRGYSCNIHVSNYFSFNRGFQEFKNPGFDEDGGFNWASWIENHKYDGPKRYLTLFRDIIESDYSSLQTIRDGLRIKLQDFGFFSSSSVDSGAGDVLEYVSDLQTDGDSEFLFLNLMEAHGPYRAPEQYRTVAPQRLNGAEATVLDAPDDVDSVRRAYNDCVRYLSDVYEEIFEELSIRYDYIITVADHGEAFGEYDGWGHFPGVWPEVTNVPLVITDTGSGMNQEPTPTDSAVSIFDVFQTVCDCCGVTPPANTRGQSLLRSADTSREYHIVETHGLPTKDYERLLNYGVDDGILDSYDSVLYGIASREGYSFENIEGGIRNWSGGASNARSKINEFRNTIDRRVTSDEVDVPKQVQEQLEDLGYA